MKTLIIASISSLFIISASAGTITLKVHPSAQKGSIRAAIFDSDKAYKTNEPLTGATNAATGETIEINFNDIVPGTYGITLFHDLNGNEELDSNLFGAPTEPFGFSNNPKIQFSAPEFGEISFEFDGTTKQIDINLIGN